jgi:hypothetical protein
MSVRRRPCYIDRVSVVDENTPQAGLWLCRNVMVIEATTGRRTTLIRYHRHGQICYASNYEMPFKQGGGFDANLLLCRS